MASRGAPEKCFVVALVLAASVAWAACSKQNELVDYKQAPPAPVPKATSAGPLRLNVDPKSTPVEKADCTGKPERKLREETSKATFRGVQVGDGTKIIIGRPDRSVAYLEVGGEEVAQFVLTHKKAQLDVSYEVLERCVENAGGYIPALRLLSAKAGDLTLAAWLARIRANPAEAEAAKTLFKRYVDEPFEKK